MASGEHRRQSLPWGSLPPPPTSVPFLVFQVVEYPLVKDEGLLVGFAKLQLRLKDKYHYSS
jgi:hypothetical protein